MHSYLSLNQAQKKDWASLTRKVKEVFALFKQTSSCSMYRSSSCGHWLYEYQALWMLFIYKLNTMPRPWRPTGFMFPIPRENLLTSHHNIVIKADRVILLVISRPLSNRRHWQRNVHLLPTYPVPTHNSIMLAARITRLDLISSVTWMALNY